MLIMISSSPHKAQSGKKKGHAAYELSKKFGAGPAAAVELIERLARTGYKVGICFHVGSQIEDPDTYDRALKSADWVRNRAGVEVHLQDESHPLILAAASGNATGCGARAVPGPRPEAREPAAPRHPIPRRTPRSTATRYSSPRPPAPAMPSARCRASPAG